MDSTRAAPRSTKALLRADAKALNLQNNVSGVLECHGRIQGKYPIYLPTRAVFTRKLVEKVHRETVHGGVGLTMAAVREQYWVPKLRSLTKSVRSECYGCKRFTATPVTAPAPGHLPEDRTTMGAAFEVIGVDFAGAIRYKQNKKSERKGYLAIFACSLSRAVHLELLPSLVTDQFITSLLRSRFLGCHATLPPKRRSRVIAIKITCY